MKFVLLVLPCESFEQFTRERFEHRQTAGSGNDIGIILFAHNLASNLFSVN